MRRLFGLNTLAGQLTLWTALTVGAIMTALIVFAYRSARQDIIDQTKRNALAEVQIHAGEIDAQIGRVAALVTTMAIVQGARGPDAPDGILDELRRVIESFPPEEVFGVYYAFENRPYTDPRAMPWIDRKN